MKNKKRDITVLIMSIVGLILLNFVGSFVFHRFDLTSEKRYTLSDATKKLLSQVDDVIYVQVYMGKDEDFPAGFKHLRDETKEMLNEFRAYADGNVEYEFINVTANTDEKQKEEVFKQLYEKGLEPTNLNVKEEGGTTQKIIWPGAIVTYKGKEIAWKLLKTNHGLSPEMQLNNSVQALEYEFASCIRNLNTTVRPKIGMLEGHGELDNLSLNDIAASLSEFYDVKRVALSDNVNALNDFKAIIIAKPSSLFSDNDKFILDQFVMRGGKILWAIDPLYTSIDSLRKSGGTIAGPYELGLEDILFKYGVRINPNLLVDLQSSAIPVNKALMGQEPRFELMPWLFSPLIMPLEQHPIVKNLEVIKLEFTSSIDTISTQGINKTILLKTSRYAKIIKAPVTVDLRMANIEPDETLLTDSYQPVAVLLEGNFESVFKNRVRPALANGLPFKEKSVQNQMIVISDGDVIRNEVQYSTSKPYPLGYDKYTNQTYGNKNFILNCVNYLCDDSGLISVRARELTLRLLNKKKVHTERLKWQVINVAFPLLLVLVFGVGYSYARKRKYAR